MKEFNTTAMFLRNVNSTAKMLQTVVTSCCKSAFGIDPFDPTYAPMHAAVVQTLEEIDKDFNTFRNRSWKSDADRRTFRKWTSVLQKATFLKDMFPVTVMRKVTIFSGKLFAEQNAVARADAGMYTARPVVIGLHGQAGLGKTTILKCITQLVGRALHFTPNANITFTKPLESDYWDGYVPVLNTEDGLEGTIAANFDDFLQSNDVNGRRKDVLELMRMANAELRALNMSAVEDKKDYYFNSPLMTYSTNMMTLPNHEHMGIISREAFTRRVDLMLEMTRSCNDGTTTLWNKKCFRALADSPTLNVREGDTLTAREVYELTMACHSIHRDASTNMSNERVFASFDSVVEDEYSDMESSVPDEEEEVVVKRKPIHRDRTWSSRKVRFPRTLSRVGKVQSTSAASKTVKLEEECNKTVEEGSDEESTDARVFMANLPTAQSDDPEPINMPEMPMLSPPQVAFEREQARVYLASINADTNSLTETFMSYLRTPEGQTVVVLILVAALAAILYKLKKGFGSSPSWEDGEPQSDLTRVQRVRQRPQIRARNVTRINKLNKAQALFDSTKTHNSIMKLKKLCASLIFATGKSESVTRGVVVGKGRFLVAAHSIPDMFEVVEISSSLGSETISSSDTMVELFGSDLAIVDVGPQGFNTPFSLRKYMVEEAPPEGSEMYLLTDAGNTILARNSHVGHVPHLKYTTPTGVIKTDNGFSYNIDTAPGDCGSIVLASVNGHYRFVGIHVAGNTHHSMGYAEFIPQSSSEFFDEIFTVDDLLDENRGEALLRNLDRVGETPSVYPYNRINQRTALKVSPMFGLFGKPTKRPARLTGPGPNGTVLESAASKLKSICRQSVPVTKVNEALGRLDAIYPKMAPYKRLDTKTALQGQAHNPMVMSTSGGLMDGSKNKCDWCDRDKEGRWVPKPALEERVEKRLELASRGVRTLTLYAAQLKDEKRDLERVALGKTRLFCAAPFDYCLAVRALFLPLITELERLHVEGPIKVGLNVHSYEWSQLYRSLCKANHTLFAGDFSNFDGTIPEALLRAAVHWIVKHSNVVNKDEQQMYTILAEVIDFRLVVGRQVYRCIGNPSGNPLTTVLNCIVNFIVMYVAVDTVREQYDLDFDMDDVTIATYGDDNIVSVPCKDFPVHCLPDVVKHLFGMTYTNADKGEELRALQPSELTFLSRSFRKTPKQMDAPLPLDTVKEICYYTRGSKSEVAANMVSALQSTLLELTHFPKEVYDECLDTMYSHPYFKNIARFVKPRLYGDAKALRYGQQVVEIVGQCCVRPVVGQPSSSARNLPGAAWPAGPFIHKTEQRTTAADFMRTMKRWDPNGDDNGNQDKADIASEESTAQAPKQDSQAIRTTIEHKEPTQQLTQNTMFDANVGIEGTVNKATYSKYHATLPTEEYKMSGIIDRSYRVAQIEWNTDHTPDTVLWDANFPDVLLNQASVIDRFNGSKFGRFGVELTVQVNSQFFCSGLCVLVNKPVPSYVEDSIPNSAIQACGWKNATISAAAKESVVMHLPFIWPSNVMDVEQMLLDKKNAVATGLHKELHHVRLMVLVPLRTSNEVTPSSIRLNIWAKLVDLSLYAPNPMISLPALVKPPISETYPTEWYHRARLKQVRDEKKKVDKIVGQSFLSELVPGVVGALTNNLLSTPHKEAKKVQKTGDDTGLSEGEDKPPDFSLISMAGGLVHRVRHKWGFQKPTSIAAEQRCTLSYDGGMSKNSGVDFVENVMPTKVSYVSSDPSFAGENEPEDDLRHITGTPSVLGVYDLQVGESFDFPVNPHYVRVEGGKIHPTILSHTARAFSYWRGGMKYMLQIVSSASVSGRIKISFYPGDSAVTDSEDLYSNTIDIAGDTLRPVFIPFLTDRIVLSADEPLGNLKLECLSLSVPGNPSYKFTVVVWVAGAEDFELLWPGSQLLSTASPAQNVGQSYMRARFKETFEPFHSSFKATSSKGVTMNQDYKTLKDLLSYYSPTHAASLEQSAISVNGASVNATFDGNAMWPESSWDGVEIPNMRHHFSRLYLFFRGGTRYKVVSYPTAGNPIVATLIHGDINVSTNIITSADEMLYYGSPLVMANTQYRNMAEVEVPYMYPAIFLPTRAGELERSKIGDWCGSLVPQIQIDARMAPAVKDTTTVYHGRMEIYTAVSDDFRFGYLVCPPPEPIPAPEPDVLVIGSIVTQSVSTVGNVPTSFESPSVAESDDDFEVVQVTRKGSRNPKRQ